MPEQDLFGDVPAAAPAPSPRQPRSPAAPARHSWFFALRPAPADAVRIDALAETLLSAQGLVGKRIGPDRLHITLELVGYDVDDGVVDAACRAADILHLPAIDVRFDAATTFATPKGPFVLLGAEGSDGLNGVRELRTTLCFALADQGFKPSRSYAPHMTLCYDPRQRVDHLAIAPIGFHAAEFALVKSHIGFSRHEVVRTWALKG